MDPGVSFIEIEKNLSRVQRLCTRHLFDVQFLMAPHLEELKDKGLPTQIFTDRIHSFLESETEKKVLFGFYNDQNELISTMSLYCWNSLPCATLSYMFVKKNFGLFNSHRNGLNYLLHTCLTLGEKQNVRSFYSLQKAKSFYHKKKTWRQFDTEITKRYYSVPEYEIPAFTRSEYSMVWDIMDNQIRPNAVILWLTRLKPEYEKKMNWGY